VRRPGATFGEFVAAISGVALVASLFFTWYGFDVDPVEASASGWQSLTVIDIALALVSALAVGHWLARRSGALERRPLPIAPAAAVAVAGGLALVLVCLRIVDLPDAVAAADLDGRRVGTFLALFASIGIVLGSVAALAERGEPWRQSRRGRLDASGDGTAAMPVVRDADRRPDEP
jgi:hypothetical protein